MMKNFFEDNVAHANRLSISDVKKALPFMSDVEAEAFLLRMNIFLQRKHADMKVLQLKAEKELPSLQ